MTTVPALLLSERRRRQDAECNGYVREAGTPGIGASEDAMRRTTPEDGLGTGFEKRSLRAIIDRGKCWEGSEVIDAEDINIIRINIAMKLSDPNQIMGFDSSWASIDGNASVHSWQGYEV